ncbi:hypothetical protein Ciccas_011339, partial [Cichlidogyrus casuarinus]
MTVSETTRALRLNRKYKPDTESNVIYRFDCASAGPSEDYPGGSVSTPLPGDGGPTTRTGGEKKTTTVAEHVANCRMSAGGSYSFKLYLR